MEAGLYYYRARYYDSKIGRFVSNDPVGFRAGINFYAYVWNNPIKRIDPLGMLPVEECPGTPKYGFTCCKDGQPAYCVDPIWWKGLSQKARDCLQAHETGHADDWRRENECGAKCDAPKCTKIPLKPRDPEEVGKRHCELFFKTYDCLKGSGEQDADGVDLENYFYDFWLKECKSRGF